VCIQATESPGMWGATHHSLSHWLGISRFWTLHRCPGMSLSSRCVQTEDVTPSPPPFFPSLERKSCVGGHTLCQDLVRVSLNSKPIPGW